MKYRKCRECLEYVKGRSDKVFCSDHCRNTYNNRLQTEHNRKIRSVNRILRQNRSILLQLATEGLQMIDREVLINRGFRMNYVTSIFTSQQGQVYHFCYDHGFISAGGRYLTLIRQEDQPMG